MAPPTTKAVLVEKVQLMALTVPPELRMEPANRLELAENVQLVALTVPPELTLTVPPKLRLPCPFKAEPSAMVRLTIENVTLAFTQNTLTVLPPLIVTW